jgi:NAD(P)-dependent dehydrogenase (short-subunit alcohol dehydrogenase family)
MGELVLAGHAALVTGGGSGIGLACGRHLLRDGATVTIAGRSQARLDEAAASLRGEAPAAAEVRTATCDAAVEDEVAAAVEAATAVTGGLQHCVASAGTAALGPVIAMPSDQWRRVLGINLDGAFFTLKHVGRGHGALRRRRLRGDLLDRGAADPPVHVGLLRVEGRPRGPRAHGGRRAGAGACSRQRRTAGDRLHRAGGAPGAGSGGPGRLPGADADLPHGDGGRRGPWCASCSVPRRHGSRGGASG